MTIGFNLRQGWQTLRARPGLSVLAIVLLALALWLCAGLLGTLFLLNNLRHDLLENLTADIELRSDVTDAQKAHIIGLAEQCSGVGKVSYISPDSALTLHSTEVGEDLQDIFGGNPFLPVLRIQFEDVSQHWMDSLAVQAIQWEGVADVIFPRELWQRLNLLAKNLQGSTGLIASVLLLISLFMIALVLRAQFATRHRQWRLLQLLGMTSTGLRFVAFAQAGTVGTVAGVLAIIGLWILESIYSLVFLEAISLPLTLYAIIFLAGITLSLLIGFAIPRTVKSFKD